MLPPDHQQARPLFPHPTKELLLARGNVTMLPLGSTVRVEGLCGKRDMKMLNIRLKRAYDPATPGDGPRVLVDRVWPRGITRERLRIQAWLPDLGPSTALRKWFGHDP